MDADGKSTSNLWGMALLLGLLLGVMLALYLTQRRALPPPMPTDPGAAV